MKKKIKDLTLGELKNICKKNTESCYDCPLFELDFLCKDNPMDYTDNALNKEIEVEENE